MNKIFLLGTGISVLGLLVLIGTAQATPIYQPPNVGNSNFYPLMQHQMEKEETLDFVNDSENYKKRTA